MSTAKPIRLGLIGAGRIARMHLMQVGESLGTVELAAVCDIVESAAAERAQQAGLSTQALYTDPSRMIREASIDAVSICTTHDSHAPLAIEAAEAGKHVLVENPMANTLEECRAMIATAERAGVTLMVSQIQRFKPAHVAIRSMIEGGLFGEVRGGASHWQQNIVRARGNDAKKNWLLDGKATGGGVLIALGVHQIDTLRYWLGNVESVFAVNRVCDPAFVNGAEDYAMVTLTFKSGAVVQLLNLYSLFAWPSDLRELGYFLSGASGTMVNERVCFEAPAKGIVGDFTPAVDAALAHGMTACDDPGATRMMHHFGICCREGKMPVCSGRDNLNTIKTVAAVYASAARGQPVELAEIDAPADAR